MSANKKPSPGLRPQGGIEKEQPTPRTLPVQPRGVKDSPAVVEIAKLHSEILEATRKNLPKAIRIGELLTGIKASLEHGQWLPWLESNAPFSDRTARNYIRVFEDRLKLETVSGLTGAYRLLAAPDGSNVELHNTFVPEGKSPKQLIKGAADLLFDFLGELEDMNSRGDRLQPESVAKLKELLSSCHCHLDRIQLEPIEVSVSMIIHIRVLLEEIAAAGGAA